MTFIRQTCYERQMKSAAEQRRKFKRVKADVAVIAHQIRGQAQLDSMLMLYPDARRKIIFKHMRPFLRFDAAYPTDANTALVTSESFAKMREKYAVKS